MSNRVESEADRDDGHSSVSEVSELLQSRATYRSLVDSLPLCLLIKDADGRRMFANKAYLQLRGMTLDELVGKRDEEMLPPEKASLYREHDLLAMNSRESLRNVEETTNKDGQTQWIESVKSPIFDESGRAIGIQILFWDVTDRVQVEQELRHEKGLLATLLKHIPDAIYFKDRESRFLRVSEAMAAKFGLENAAAVEGLTDAEIFTDEHARAARQDELRIMQTRQALVEQLEKETWANREDTWCRSSKLPLVNDEGEVTGTFGISHDITELKKSQDALREARDIADQANQAKSEFLANMSHEIRTPMNAVIGMSELLSQTQLSDEQRDYVELVRDSANSLLTLLNDILDFSKIEARKLELESIPFSIRDLVEKTGRTLALRAGEKGLELACRVAAEIPDRLLGDPGRLRQVLINLVGNAIKFTDEGEVVIEVTIDESFVASSDDDHLPLCFRVRDTGIGIPDDKQASVLEAFMQADSSTTRRYGGTGLGLAISSQLVQLMGGKLQLASQVGQGTTFYFTVNFPIAPAEESDATAHLEQLGTFPVLIVDDSATNRRILQEVLDAWKLAPVLASSGEMALETIDAAARTGEPFPIAILDYMMPEMDGFELARRIRLQYSPDHIKLIILSSSDLSGDVDHFKELGIAHYLTKPVVQSELLDKVLQVMGARPLRTQPSGEPAPICPPLRVLVAEDGLANQHVAIGMLKAAGHQAVVANDGRETIAHWQSEPFDVILMDMHMPVMDGVEATKKIRSKERNTGKHIPIIALTAAAMNEDAEACRRAGMDAFLTKPIHPRKLQEMLAKFAPQQSVMSTSSERRERRDSSDATLSDDRIAEQLANQPIVMDESIDLRAVAVQATGGMRGLQRLAEVFIPECESLIETLRAEIPSGDAAQIQRAAHTLKGSANLFLADKVYDAAFSIERLAQQGKLESADAALVTLEQEVDRLLAALRNFLDLTAS